MLKGCQGYVIRLTGLCKRVEGVMLHGGKIKSTPTPRPKTGVRQFLGFKNFKNFIF